MILKKIKILRKNLNNITLMVILFQKMMNIFLNMQKMIG